MHQFYTHIYKRPAVNHHPKKKIGGSPRQPPQVIVSLVSVACDMVVGGSTIPLD